MNSYAGNPGRSSHRLSAAAAEKIFECRDEIAALFGSDSPENVIFTYNATYAINMALKGVVRPGDHILISNIEHNSVYRPVWALSGGNTTLKSGSGSIYHETRYPRITGGASGISFSVFDAKNPDAKHVIKSISDSLMPNTRIIIVSQASNICGLHLPVAEIGKFCRKNGIIFIVDASQSAGIRDINIKRDNIDILCAPGHKGLYGPQGTGFLLVSGSLSSKLSTIIEGGNGVNSLLPEMPEFLPERLEAGTLAVPVIAGLCEGVKFVRKMGTEAILSHESALCSRLCNMLKSTRGITVYADGYTESSVLLFNVDKMKSSDVSEILGRNGICTRSGLHCSPLAHKMLETGEDGAVRVSFGIFNKPAEVESFYKILRSEMKLL